MEELIPRNLGRMRAAWYTATLVEIPWYVLCFLGLGDVVLSCVDVLI